MRPRISSIVVTVRRRGLTLIESMIAVSLTTLAGGALLSTVGSTMQVSTDSTNTAIAQGLADQLMDEIAAVKFPRTSTIPMGVGRSGFDDLDDYHNWNASPPQTRDGMVIGTERISFGSTTMLRPTNFQPDPRVMSHFRQQVTVEKIAEGSGNTWVVVTTATPLRRVTVNISYTDSRNQTRSLAVQTRVFSDVAVAP